MDPMTKALHTRIDDREARPAVTPLYQCSGFEAGSPFFYSRKNNPNTAELEKALCTLEGVEFALAVTTGMTAVALTLDLVRAGDHLVVNKDIYGCSMALLRRLAGRRDFRVSLLDLSRPEMIDRIPDDVGMVFLETPTNPFLRTIDIGKVSRRVKERNGKALVVVDNTWATPVFQRPLAHGADLSLHSATKFLSGHSDVMGGFVLTDRRDLHEDLRETRFYAGAVLDPHSAWLLRRSVQTLGIRMNAHQEVTLRMRAFLEGCEQVEKVYYPTIDGRQLIGYGGILFFDLREDLVDRYPAFVKALTLFDSGTAMACVTSMVAQPSSGSHASLTEEEKASMGLGPGLVRLCFGLENPVELERDLARAFTAMEE